MKLRRLLIHEGGVRSALFSTIVQGDVPNVLREEIRRFAYNMYISVVSLNWQQGHDCAFQDHPKAAQDAGQMATKSAIAHIEVATPVGIRTLVKPLTV